MNDLNSGNTQMARPLAFDETQALRAAANVFRRLGYGGVSIKRLETETGLSSGSLYNSFGDKPEIFTRALRHYNDTVVDRRIRAHLDQGAPVDGLIALFESLLHEPGGTDFGCLLTNSAVEFAGADTFAAAEIRRGFDRFLDAFRDCLMRRPGADPSQARQSALRLLAFYQGLLVLIRHGHDKAALRSIIRTEIEAIAGERHD